MRLGVKRVGGDEQGGMAGGVRAATMLFVKIAVPTVKFECRGGRAECIQQG